MNELLFFKSMLFSHVETRSLDLDDKFLFSIQVIHNSFQNFILFRNLQIIFIISILKYLIMVKTLIKPKSGKHIINN